MEELYFKTRDEWREWLKTNHDQSGGIWLIFYKKHTGLPSIDYEAVVEESLCFGWVDSIIRKIDDERYARKITPRKSNSKWSQSNKNRVERLIRQGNMEPTGLKKVNEAKRLGNWDKPDGPLIPESLADEFASALAGNNQADKFFQSLAPSYQKRFFGWIADAKRKETREKRIRESITLLENGKKLEMK